MSGSPTKRVVFAKATALYIHLWCPDMFGAKGGIGVFSGFLLKAIQDWGSGVQCDVILKHDSPGEIESNGSLTRFHYAGKWPLSLRTEAYATKLLALGFIRRPDLIITTHLNFTAAARLLNRFTGVPYWTVAHGIEAWNLERRSLRTALHHADHILAVSGYTRQRLLAEQSLNPRKISILPNTVDVERFKIGSKPERLLQHYKFTRDQPVILTVSRLVASEQYKGYDRVLRALPEIRKDIPSVRYLIVGDGDDRPRIQGLIEELGLGDCVTLSGYVPDNELCDHYNLCDVFAMPSKREGFGIVYLEAMSCGKPALGGNKDGAIDALFNGELGALVDPDDTSKLAATLVEILRGNYPLPLMYQPECLRARVIELYGYDRFRQTLKMHLDSFFGLQN